MGNPSSRSDVRRLSAFIALVVLSVYSFPYLATTFALKSKLVPFSFAADLSLYLNLSKDSSSMVNPYFGTVVRSGDIGYLTFGAAFRLLGLFVKISGNHMWWAVLFWNLFWWAAMFAGALWLLRIAFPGENDLNLCLAMSLLFFFNFGVVKALFLAWLRLPSLNGFDGLTLPYIRLVFPQIPLALLFFYVGLQVRALRWWRGYEWTGMFFLQAVAFAVFPYATLMMAGTTLVAVLADLVIHQRPKRLGVVVAYGAACALIDIAFLWSQVPGGRHGSGVALVGFHPSRAISLAGGGLLLMVLLMLATAILPPVESASSKWTIVGLGFANSLLMLGDTIFSPDLLVSIHGGYFVHTTISLQIVYLLSVVSARFGRESVLMRGACLAAIVFVTANGLVLAFADYRYSMPENATTNELASALRSIDVTKEDLVIARAESVDDLCSWIPLLTPSTVLFCRSAQYELSSEEKNSVYRLRQAFYLSFTGKDSRAIERIATDSRDIAEQDRLAFAGEINNGDKERWDRGIQAIRTDLAPMLEQVERRDRRVLSFFSPYQQVLIVDDARKPIFVRERLLGYFSIESEQRSNDFVFLWCKPL